jgi:hypothetical protein
MTTRRWLSFLIFIFASQGAGAVVINTLTDSTNVDGGHFARPFEDFSGLDPVANNVWYKAYRIVIPFTPLDHTYSFLVTAQTPGFDTFAFLYSGGFDPFHPLDNGLIANDDANVDSSKFIVELPTSLVDYYLVVTGYNNQDFGQFQLEIQSPAGVGIGYLPGVEAVPLPAAGWLLLSGIAGIAAVARRRKA